MIYKVHNIHNSLVHDPENTLKLSDEELAEYKKTVTVAGHKIEHGEYYFFEGTEDQIKPFTKEEMLAVKEYPLGLPETNMQGKPFNIIKLGE